MSKLLNNITSQIKENSVEENLFVKNIIVNKNKNKFNDIDSRVEIPNINLGNNFTIVLSAKANDLVDFGELLNVGSNLTMNISNDTTFRKHCQVNLRS